MARFYRDSDIRLDEQILAAEKRLDALYAKRAGRRNTRVGEPAHGWMYCNCGRVNQNEGYPECRHCANQAGLAAARAIIAAHYAGMHAFAPDNYCSLCYAKKEAR